MDMGASGLTIVIPAYRCARYLPATVESALACAGARVLIAEDCGGDQTLNVARELERRNPDRIGVVANPRNLGMTGNWQQALSAVATPLALKLDGDDIVRPEYVAAAVKFLEAHPEVGVVGGGVKEVDERFGVEEPVPRDSDGGGFFRDFSGSEALRFIIEWAPYPASSSTIYRMEHWREAGGFDVGLKWCSDREIWFRLARRGAVGFYTGTAIYYRVLPTSESARARRGDLYCYELSRMLRRAKREWGDASPGRMMRKAFLVNAKAFFGSATRAMRAGRFREVFPRAAGGVGDLCYAIF